MAEQGKPTKLSGAEQPKPSGLQGEFICFFCGKSQREVKTLVRGPGAVCICDECVDVCVEIIEELGGGTPQEREQQRQQEEAGERRREAIALIADLKQLRDKTDELVSKYLERAESLEGRAGEERPGA